MAKNKLSPMMQQYLEIKAEYQDIQKLLSNFKHFSIISWFLKQTCRFGSSNSSRLSTSVLLIKPSKFGLILTASARQYKIQPRFRVALLQRVFWYN